MEVLRVEAIHQYRHILPGGPRPLALFHGNPPLHIGLNLPQ